MTSADATLSARRRSWRSQAGGAGYGIEAGPLCPFCDKTLLRGRNLGRHQQPALSVITVGWSVPRGPERQLAAAVRPIGSPRDEAVESGAQGIRWGPDAAGAERGGDEGAARGRRG